MPEKFKLNFIEKKSSINNNIINLNQKYGKFKYTEKKRKAR